MIPVEKAVRPVCASQSRKLRMREELYSLIEERYRSFLAEGLSEADAQQGAIAAFGDPPAIAAELRKTVPAWNRWSRQFDNFLFAGAFEPTIALAIHTGLCLTTIMGAWLLGMNLFLALIKPNYPALAIAVTFGTLAAIFGVNASLGHWLAGRTIKKLLARHYATVLLHAILFGLVFAASIALLYLSASGEFFLRSGWMKAAMALPVATSMDLFICWLASFEVAQREPWESLELD
jgi:hypothetical protein